MSNKYCPKCFSSDLEHRQYNPDDHGMFWVDYWVCKKCGEATEKPLESAPSFGAEELKDALGVSAKELSERLRVNLELSYFSMLPTAEELEGRLRRIGEIMVKYAISVKE